MKVLLIDVNCRHSSTGQIVYDLYTELNRRGHTAAICYGRGPTIVEPNVYKFSSNVEVYAHALLTRLTGLTGCYSYFATRNLLRFMDEFRPDVVHVHELHAYFVNLAPVINYLKNHKLRTVWTFHCEFMYTGKCGYAFDCNKWKDECGQCPRVREYPSSLLFDFTKKMFKEKVRLFSGFDHLTLVAPSKWLANRVRQSFLADRDIRVVHNGIDIENVFHPRIYEHLRVKHNITDEKVVLAVAPDLMSERKGGRWVVELAKKLKGDRSRLILIGIDDLTEKFDDNVIALGRTANQQELAEYYSMADVFVICSKMENFPTTCIEALACGAPICGFDAGGTRETAPEGCGVFVPYGDVDRLAAAVRELMSSATDTRSAACAQYGADNYSKSVMCRNYIELY